MDIALCSERPRGDRTLGDSAICNATEPIGRLVIGEQVYLCSLPPSLPLPLLPPPHGYIPHPLVPLRDTNCVSVCGL